MWIKFAILFILYSVFVWFFAPSLKWKILFTIGGALGIYLALAGKSIKGFTPLSKRR